MDTELTPEIIDGLNKLAFFIREHENKKTTRRLRCPSCDDGIYYPKQVEKDDETSDDETSTN